MERFNEWGYFTGHIPPECVAACSHSGDCGDDVEYWRKLLNFSVPRDQAIAYLREFGAWPMQTDKYDRGLTDMTDEELAIKVLWLACCDLKETGEWLGLCH